MQLSTYDGKIGQTSSVECGAAREIIIRVFMVSLNFKRQTFRLLVASVVDVDSVTWRVVYIWPNRLLIVLLATG